MPSDKSHPPASATHDPNTWCAEFGARLRAARSKVGMTRKRLAVASGASERYLALIEAGDGNPSLSIMQALAGALDVAVAELLPLGGECDARYAEAAAAVRRLLPERLPSLLEWTDRPPGQAGSKGARIVLLGLRGAGKTSLGKALAKRLKAPFVEVSKKVEEAYGGDLGLLIELSGQAALHRYESDVWEEIVSSHESAVIAAPGGVVADGALYGRILATAHSIWLQASPEDHMTRVMEQGDFRPMKPSRGAMSDLKAILSARSSEYARADAQLDTSAQPFRDTLELLVRSARTRIATAPEI